VSAAPVPVVVEKNPAPRQTGLQVPDVDTHATQLTTFNVVDKKYPELQETAIEATLQDPYPFAQATHAPPAEI